MGANLETLNDLVNAVSDLKSRLILLVAPSGGGKTRFLRQYAGIHHYQILNVSLLIGRRLAVMPHGDRTFATGKMLRALAEQTQGDGPLLLDNLEIFFEPSLLIDPLALIKRLALDRPLVAVWPGELRGDRLVYADMSHPEHRDYSRDGVVVLEI